MRPVDVVAAWIAGMDHVMRCKGCPVCKVPDDFVPPPEEPKPDEETPLDEAVKPKYDSPWKDPFGRPK